MHMRIIKCNVSHICKASQSVLAVNDASASLQGEKDATRFYVLHEGVCEVHIKRAGTTSPQLVMTCRPGRYCSMGQGITGSM
jgi:hypothetical protein